MRRHTKTKQFRTIVQAVIAVLFTISAFLVYKELSKDETVQSEVFAYYRELSNWSKNPTENWIYDRLPETGKYGGYANEPFESSCNYLATFTLDTEAEQIADFSEALADQVDSSRVFFASESTPKICVKENALDLGKFSTLSQIQIVKNENIFDPRKEYDFESVSYVGEYERFDGKTVVLTFVQKISEDKVEFLRQDFTLESSKGIFGKIECKIVSIDSSHTELSMSETSHPEQKINIYFTSLENELETYKQ